MKKTNNISTLFIRQLDSNDNINGLSLGKREYTPLKTFLKKTALDFHLHNIAKSYVLIDDKVLPKVYGYLTLMCSELIIDGVQRPQ